MKLKQRESLVHDAIFWYYKGLILSECICGCPHLHAWLNSHPDMKTGDAHSWSLQKKIVAVMSLSYFYQPAVERQARVKPAVVVYDKKNYVKDNSLRCAVIGDSSEAMDDSDSELSSPPPLPQLC